MDRNKVDSKIKKFQFHHEMTTDGVAVYLLYSREVEVKGKNNRGDHCKRPESSEERYPGRRDPGTKNLVTMTDTSGITLRSTCRQRRFEGKLPRYLRGLEKEKAETDGLLQAERDLSNRKRSKQLEHSKLADEGIGRAGEKPHRDGVN